MADSDSPVNIQEELAALLGDEPYILDLPTSFSGITSALYELRRWTVQIMAIRLKRVPPAVIEPEMWKKLTAYLATLYNLEVIDPEMKTKAQLDKGLEVIFNPIYNFPKEYQRVAKFIYNDLEKRRWGADEAEVEDISDDESMLARSLPDVPNMAGTEHQATALLTSSAFPDDTDPIYGNKGIMHHILRKQGPKMTSYQINPSFKSRNAKSFGHHGFCIGDCWPMQLALVRDGAHGQRMGGISGSAPEGAYSIVVSGMYDRLDNDLGETLFYSGSNSHENTASEPITSNKTKALETSVSTRNPVRVFRSLHAKWKGAPRAGIRYDGLYTVVSMEIDTNEKGGAFKKFKLERNSGQDPIRTELPSMDTIKLFNRVRDGYTHARKPTIGALHS